MRYLILPPHIQALFVTSLGHLFMTPLGQACLWHHWATCSWHHWVRLVCDTTGSLVHDTTGSGLFVTPLAKACSWQHGVRLVCDTTGSACSWHHWVRPVLWHHWVRSVHDTTGSDLFMIPLGQACSKHHWVRLVHDTTRSDLFVAPLGQICSWYHWVRPVHNTTGSDLYMTPLGQACSWHHWVRPVHDTTGSDLFMATLGQACSWHHWVRLVHDTIWSNREPHNDSTHDCIFATFRHRFLTNRSPAKNAYRHSLWCLFGSVPFKRKLGGKEWVNGWAQTSHLGWFSHGLSSLCSKCSVSPQTQYSCLNTKESGRWTSYSTMPESGCTCKSENIAGLQFEEDKTHIFRLHLNEPWEGFCLTGRGRSLHVAGLTTEKVQEPTVETGPLQPAENCITTNSWHQAGGPRGKRWIE